MGIVSAILTPVFYFSYDANGVPQTVTYNNTVYQYVTNQQGDVIGIQDYNGGVYATYSYNAWGELISNCTTHPESIEFLNPLRYRGYVYDHETGLYYLQSRYYDPEIGRFLNADAYTSTGQGILGNNMFAYCGNNPVVFGDPSGFRRVCYSFIDRGGGSYSSADLAIVENRSTILSVSAHYGVDPVIVAGCIYVEQSNNYDLMDCLTDVPLCFLDTSVGVGQAKLSTVRLLNKKGYIDSRQNVGALNDYQLATKLQDDVFNITCVAAYVAYLQDLWCDVFDISQNPAIIGTMYNVGERTPNTSPKANAFGKRVETCGWYMELLLN